MVTYKEMIVQEIVNDAALSTEQKVKKLREIRIRCTRPSKGVL